VLSVTGSNGKTIFKDALKSIFSRRSVIASPGSYNGALGLPLSVLQANSDVDLGIFEVGVAGPDEMPALEAIARPTFGVLINIGMAHIAAYKDRAQIAEEKLKLFANIPESGWVLLPDLVDEPLMEKAKSLKCKVYSPGVGDKALGLKLLNTKGNRSNIRLFTTDGESGELEIRTTSPEIITDLHFAASAAWLLGMPFAQIKDALYDYEPSPTRMEVWTSPTGIKVINDSHSSDPISVGSALIQTTELNKRKRRKNEYSFSQG
jgi:UDP-N-acetylmuramyl pentapeptide synthase